MDSHLFFPIKHAKQKHEQSRAHKTGQEHAKSENNKNVKNCTNKVVYFAFFADITIGKRGKWVPLMIVWCFFQRFRKWWINQCLDSLHFPSIGKVVSHRRSQGDKIIGWEYWSKWMLRNWVCSPFKTRMSWSLPLLGILWNAPWIALFSFDRQPF